MARVRRFQTETVDADGNVVKSRPPVDKPKGETSPSPRADRVRHDDGSTSAKPKKSVKVEAKLTKQTSDKE